MALLDNWIAQANSWKSFIEFDLPTSQVADYPFIKRYDDFYLNLLNNAFELLDSNPTDEDLKKLYPFAKGLEIFSLSNTKSHFEGIDYLENFLVVSALYLLSGYSASSYLLARLTYRFPFSSEIDQFLLEFLTRDLSEKNRYSQYLKNYFLSGNLALIEELLLELYKNESQTYQDNPNEFFSYKLAFNLIKKFLKDNIVIDLVQSSNLTFNDWKDLIRLYYFKSPAIWDLFPSQKLAIQKGILSNSKTYALRMPTSSGKTSLAEILIYNHLKTNPGSKVLFLSPFRALASELKKSFQKSLGSVGIKSKALYGGNIPTFQEKIAVEDSQLLICTPEKFTAIETVISDFKSSFSMIICDEGHLIDSSSRGLSYELLISRLKSSRIENLRFIFLSAIIPNLEKVNTWLGGDENTIIDSDYRPSKINYAFLGTKDDKNYYLNVNPYSSRPFNYQLYGFLSPNDFIYIDQLTGKNKHYSYSQTYTTKSCAVALKSIISGTVALFTPHKGMSDSPSGTHSLSEKVLDLIEKNVQLPDPFEYCDQRYCNDMFEYFRVIFGDEYILTKLIKKGIGLHHGDIPQFAREIIENALRSERIRLVICNTTLAEGVNLPIKTIVINSAKRFYRSSWRPLSIRDLSNLCGRAGRAGKETNGQVIVVNPSDFSTIHKVINKQLEPVKGDLYLLIKHITKVITENRMILSNELLEKESEEFIKILDSIDISIFNLLGEEINVEELTNLVNDFIKNTFAYQELEENEKKVLEKIISLRKERVKDIIESDNYKYIKQSNLNVRLFKDIKKLIENEDIKSSLWIDLENPISDEWIDYLFDNFIFKLPQIEYEINRFKNENHIALSEDIIKKIVHYWIEGQSYFEISTQLNLSVSKILRIFVSFIERSILPLVSGINKIIEVYFAENNIPLSSVAFDWPRYLCFGVTKRLHLDLIEIGITDRIAVLALEKIMKKNQIDTYEDLDELKTLIVVYERNILEELSDIPVLSLENVKIEMQYLKDKYIL